MDFLSRILLALKRSKKVIKKKNVTILNGVITNRCNVTLGEFIFIGRDHEIHARGGVQIDDNVIISNRLTIHSSNHKYEHTNHIPYGRETILKPVKIERGVWIGDNVMICPGVTVGEGAIIGMGSVVTKNVPPFSIAGGNPAKVIRLRSDIEVFRHKLNNKNSSYLYAKSLGEIVNVEIKATHNEM